MSVIFVLLAGCGARSDLGTGAVDASAPAPCDADGDGHAPPSCGGGDCNDCDPSIHPDADDPIERPALDTLDVELDGLPGRWMSLVVDAGGVPQVALTSGSRLLLGEIAGGTLDVAEVGPSGRTAALALDDAGVPHVSYEADEGGLLHATEADGAVVVETIESDVDAGRYSDVLVSDGVVHVVYSYWRFRVGYALRHATRTASGWEIETVDGEVDSGFTPSLARGPDGRIHVAYCRYVDGEPAAVIHGVLDGGAWHLEIADEGRQVGAQPSLAIDAAGDPHVTYYAFDPEDEERRGLFHATLRAGVWTRERIAEGQNVGFFSGIVATACGLDVAYADVGRLRHATDRSGTWLDVAFEDPDEDRDVTATYLAIDAFDDEAHVVYREGAGLGHATVDLAGGIDQDCDGEDG